MQLVDRNASYVLAWEANDFVVPNWWLLWSRYRISRRLANWLYRRRFGYHAPGMMDLLMSATLHSLSPSATEAWSNVR